MQKNISLFTSREFNQRCRNSGTGQRKAVKKLRQYKFIKNICC